MIDIIFTSLLEFSPLGTLNKTTISVPNPDGTLGAKSELWYNSQSSILFGDSCSWLIGLGRITNVCGPDLKVICDWTIATEWIPGFKQLSGKYPNLYGFLMGTGGSTDFIMGGKDLFNYGATTDYAFTRKKHPNIKVDKWKYKKSGNDWDENDEDYFPVILKAAVFAPYLIILSSVVTARLAYMQVGAFSNKTVRDELQRWVIMTVPLIESRWVATIKIIETLFDSGKLIKRLTKKAKAKAKKIKEETENTTIDAGNLLLAAPVVKEPEIEAALIKKDAIRLISESKSDIIDIFDQGVAAVNVAVDVPGLDHVRFSAESSSGNIIKTAESFQYEANSKIDWVAKGPDPRSKNALIQEDWESKISMSPVQINTTTPCAGISVGEPDGGVDISVNKADGVIRLHHKGNDRSLLNIYRNSLEMQSGKNAASAPSISFADGKLTLRTGLPFIGPAITLSNDSIEMTVGLLPIRPKITMTANTVDISVGVSKLSLTPTGIEQKVGEIVSAELHLLKQTLQTAENSLTLAATKFDEQNIMTQRNTEAILELKAALAKYEAKAITTEKAPLTMKQ